MYEVYENCKRYNDLFLGYADSLEDAILVGEESGVAEFYVELNGSKVYRNL